MGDEVSIELKDNMKCRRCSDCEGSEHHWLENPYFGDFDDDEPESDPRFMYACKHCPAVGSECPDCDGLGADYEDTGLEWECERCRGFGIVAGLAALDENGDPVSGD